MKIRSYRTTRSEQNFGKRVSDEGFDTSETAYTFQRNLLTEYQGIPKKPQNPLESPGIPENPRESSENCKIPKEIPLFLYLLLLENPPKRQESLRIPYNPLETPRNPGIL